MSARDLVLRAVQQGKTSLTEIEAKGVLREAGIATTETVPASSAEEAVAIAARLGFPVALKVVTRHPIQKAALGGVVLDLRTEDEVQAAYVAVQAEMQDGALAAVGEGICVQPMMRPGVPLRMALEQDSLFGPVLSFGFGRTAMEVWEDVAHRVIPLREKDARLLLQEVKGSRLLHGYREWEPANVSRVQETLLKLSRLAEESPEIVAMDLSPLRAYRDGVVVLDASIGLRNGQPV